jgi:ATP-dependent Clp protease ATP-binding subunit ClpA
MPTELDELTRRVMQLEIEQTALEKETDEASKQRLAELKKELAELKSKADAYRARWQAEKSELGKEKELRQKIDAAKVEMEQAERRYDLSKAAEIRHGRLPALEKELAALKKEEESSGSSRLLRQEVTADEIADIISKWTGIPVSKLLEGEKQKLLSLDKCFTSASSGRTRPCSLWRTQSCAQGRTSRIRAGPSAASSSRPHRRRQDGACPHPRRDALRQRGQHGAPRHERIMEKLR